MKKTVLLAIVILSFAVGPTVFAHDLPRTLPTTIRVGIREKGKITKCVTVDFNFYVKHVLPQEWKDIYDMESLKAGAVAIKEYAWYLISSGGKYAGNSKHKDKNQPCDADVDNTALSQVYDPKTDLQFNNYTKTDFAVDSVWDVGMYKNGRPFLPEYRNVNPGRNRMSQVGSNKLASAGKTYEEILRNYYGGPKLSFFSILPRPQNCPIQNGRNQCQLFLPFGVDRPEETACNQEGNKTFSDACVELPSVALTKGVALSSYAGIVDFAKNKYALASIKEFIQTLDQAVRKHDAAVINSAANYDVRKLIRQWGVSNALKMNKQGNGYEPPDGYSNAGCYALGCAVDIRLLTYRDTDPTIGPNSTPLNPDGKIAIPPIENNNSVRVQEMWNLLKDLQKKNDICSAFNYYFDGMQGRTPHFHVERWGLGDNKCV